MPINNHPKLGPTQCIYPLYCTALLFLLSTVASTLPSRSAKAAGLGQDLGTLVQKYQGLKSSRASNASIPTENSEVTQFADNAILGLIREAQRRLAPPTGIQFGWIVFGSWARQELSVVSDLDLLLVALNVPKSSEGQVRKWGLDIQQDVSTKWEAARTAALAKLNIVPHVDGEHIQGNGLQLDWVERGVQTFATSADLIAFMAPKNTRVQKSALWTDARLLSGTIDYAALRKTFEDTHAPLFQVFASEWAPALNGAKSAVGVLSAKQIFTRGLTLEVGELYRQWRKKRNRTADAYEASTLGRLAQLRADNVIDAATQTKTRDVFLRSLKWEVDSGVATWAHGSPLKSTRTSTWLPWRTLAPKFTKMCDDSLSIDTALQAAHARLR